MKTKLIASSLLVASLSALGSAPAMASDEFAGLLIGAGAGAVVGHAMGGGDGAVIGGFLGALLGAAVADDDRRTVVVRQRPHAVYGPAPVRYHAQPRYWEGPRWEGPQQHRHPNWNNDRDGRWDDRRGQDRRDGDKRGGRSDGPRDYRNW